MTERDLLDRLIHRWHARQEFHGVDSPAGRKAAEMLPILEAIGVKIGDQKWFELAQNETATKKPTIDLSPLLLKTIEIALNIWVYKQLI